MLSGRAGYITFMTAAAVVFMLVRWLQPRPAELKSLPLRDRLALLAAAFCGAMVGAKLPFLGGDMPWLADGKTVVTGMIGGYLGVELAKWGLGVTIKTGDSWALPLAAGLSVGRWGCFFNGCCYGLPTTLPWGVDFGDGVARHPTQVYEFGFHLLMSAVLVVLIRGRRLRHQRLKLYLTAYGCFRFATEFIRPAPLWAAGLTFYQWAALALVVGLSIQWCLDDLRQRRALEMCVPAEEPA